MNNKEELHKNLMLEIDKFVEKARPACNIRVNDDGKTVCNSDDGLICCHCQCPFLSKTGCTTKNVSCKLFYCTNALAYLQKHGMIGKLRELQSIAELLGIRLAHRRSFDQVTDIINEDGMNALEARRKLLNRLLFY